MKISVKTLVSKKIIFLIIPFLGACAQTNQIVAGDGQSAISVDCSGPVSTWQMCYDKIGAVCGAYGYEVIRSTLDGNSIRGKESSERIIVARCKN
jgi:hypothetical protein